MFLIIRKTKTIAKFEGLEPRRCEDIKGIVAPEIGPKSFGAFEKQAPERNSTLTSTIQVQRLPSSAIRPSGSWSISGSIYILCDVPFLALSEEDPISRILGVFYQGNFDQKISQFLEIFALSTPLHTFQK